MTLKHWKRENISIIHPPALRNHIKDKINQSSQKERIINIKINKLEKKKTIEKIKETKNGSLEIKLTNSSKTDKEKKR